MTYLTKTTYLHAVQCRKRFWLGRFAPHLLEPADPIREEAIRQGQAVGAAARSHFPGGVLIEGHGEPALRRTRAALHAGAAAIFEAAFQVDDALVRCDILENNGNGTWTLVEVKSSAGVKAHYLHDLAIQAHIAAKTGLRLARTELMHINSKTCYFPHLSNLFVRADVTKQVRGLLDELPNTLPTLQALLRQPATPIIAIGAHCTAPHTCPFQHHCWENVPPTSVFTIPRLAKDKLDELIARGILDLRAIPADFPLTPAQRAYITFVRAGRPRIDRAGIRASLAELQYPLYFFDFETDAPAIPCWQGMRPYQNFPFQYSCHVLHADGRLEHREYLHERDDDPRPALLEHLLHDLGIRGSIIAYNAPFERGVLRSLASALPHAAQRLAQMEERLWDQLAVMRRHYDHPDFLNSKSIKRVLPVLVPELSYDELGVQRGDEAQIVWRQMIRTADAELRNQLAADLRAYCRHDTLAMVKIHEVLANLA